MAIIPHKKTYQILIGFFEFALILFLLPWIHFNKKLVK
jgi:hypothetical protein